MVPVRPVNQTRPFSCGTLILQAIAPLREDRVWPRETRYILQIYDPSPKGEGFISGKLLMTEDEGRILVEYTVLAVVHIIYTMETSR